MESFLKAILIIALVCFVGYFAFHFLGKAFSIGSFFSVQ
jgi:hypothetical protein